MKRIFFISIIFCAFSCQPDSSSLPVIETEVSRIMHEGSLSHGIGYGPLDSPVLQDSINLSIFVHSRNGIQKEKLQDYFKGQDDFNSRIDTLFKYKILEISEGKIYPSVPVIIRQDHAEYMDLIIRDADEIYPLIKPDIIDLVNIIKDNEADTWMYHITWSLIFDSQFVWYELVNRGLVPPLSELISWIIYPPHPYKTGTNYYPDSEIKDSWVVVSWSPRDNGKPAEIGNNWDLIYKASREPEKLIYEEIKTLQSLGVLTKDQEIIFPVLSTNDSLYKKLQEIAIKYVNILSEKITPGDYRGLIRKNDRYIFSMIYHDLSWEIVKRLSEDNIINHPKALFDKGSDSGQGIHSVVGVYQPFIEQIYEAIEIASGN